VPLTPLIGREREVALATALLARPNVRLLTLTGPGGIGKTRLALRVAADLGSAFADGVRFVPLASVLDPALVASTVARDLGLQGVDVRPAEVALEEALRGAELLLVLDNFEHVLAAGPLVPALLTACPRLKILATSRALLRLEGEHALPVPPLAVRGDGGGPAGQEKEPAAVRLFAERARAIVPSFELTETTSAIVAAICRHLDGLPLAVELAAAQCTVLPPATLLARVEARLPLPVAGRRDAPVRLRTMRDAIAWSYDLLTPGEQTLFRRLGVFVGGFTLEAAEAICGPQGTGNGEQETGAASSSVPSSVLDGLASLIDKSQVRQEEDEGEPRFGMLETIRAFAWELLAASGEADAIGEAHADWWLAWAERHELAAALPGRERQMRQLEVDHANLRAALAWFDRRDDGERLLRLAAALGGFWLARGYVREGRDWLERALARPAAESSRARGHALISMGRLVSLFAEVELADRLLGEGIDALRPYGDAPISAFALIHRGAVANQRGDYERAESLLGEALDLATAVRDPAAAAAMASRALANLGVAAHGRGDLALAVVRHEEALRICREHGYTFGVIRSLRDLGDVDRERGDFAAAVARYRECVEILGEQGDLRAVADSLAGTALVAAVWRQPARAARLLGAADALRERYGGAFIFPDDRTMHERTLAGIRSALDEPATRSALMAGRRFTVAEAIAELRALTPTENPAGPVTRGAGTLSPREAEVLRLLVAGLPDREIAAALFLSVRTVEAHVAHILAKLGVRTRTAAVAAALAAGLVESGSPVAT
jgi:non-specific serine/threonine protein kinase